LSICLKTGKKNPSKKYHRRTTGQRRKFTLAQFQKALDAYQNIDAEKLRSHLLEFLRSVIPLRWKMA